MPDDRKHTSTGPRKQQPITVHRPRRLQPDAPPAVEPAAGADLGESLAAREAASEGPFEVVNDDMRVDHVDHVDHVDRRDAADPAHDRPIASDVNIAWREPDAAAPLAMEPTVPRSDVNIDWAGTARSHQDQAAATRDTRPVDRRALLRDSAATTATSIVAATYGRDASALLTPATRAQTILLAGAGAAANMAAAADCASDTTAAAADPPPSIDLLQEVQDRVDRARMAQADWGTRSIRERGRVLDRLRRHLYLNRKAFTTSLMEDSGIPEFEVLGVEIMAALEHLRFYRRAAAEVLAPMHRNPGFMRAGKTHEIQRVPWGVVGVIAPHQYPLAVPLAEVGAAIIAGNAVLLKLSDHHPHTTRLVRAVFEAVATDCKELPDDLLQLLPATRDHGRALAASDVDKVFFSGNADAARSVLRASAERLRPSSVTCGGQNPMIVLPDADADRAALAAVWSAFTSAGQTLSLVERVYVHESIVNAFVEQAGAITRTLRVGKSSGGFEVGGLSQAGLEIAEARIADAVAKGARIECGGRRVRGVTGGFMHPTVLADVTPEMDVWKYDNLSPILPVRAYSDLDQVVAEINGAAYGLCASVFAADLEVGRAIAIRLNVGTVAVNDAVVPYVDPALPWTGRGESGFGNSHGPEGLLQMTRVRAISLDDDTQRYKPWWFPYNNDKTEGLRAALTLRHDPSPIERLKAWVKLLFDPEVRRARAGKEPPYVPGMNRENAGTQFGPFETPLSQMFRVPTAVRRIVRKEEEPEEPAVQDALPPGADINESAPRATPPATAADRGDSGDRGDRGDRADSVERGAPAPDDVDDLPIPEAADDIDDLPIPEAADDVEDLPIPDSLDDDDEWDEPQ